jgi:hypothetical protein
MEKVTIQIPEEAISCARLTITNGVYGVLTDRDVQQTIASLGRAEPAGRSGQEALIATLEELFSNLKNDA